MFININGRHKWRYIFVFALIMAGAFFGYSDYAEASGCCLIRKSKPNGRVDGDGSKVVDCRIIANSDDVCKTEISRKCVKWEDEWLPDGRINRHCKIYIEKKEMTVACTNPFCREKISASAQQKCANFDNSAACEASPGKECAWINNGCVSIYNTSFCRQIKKSEVCGNKMKVCKWEDNQCKPRWESNLTKDYTEGGLVTGCAARGACKDVNDLLVLVMRYAQRLFSLVGVLAFVMFIYGGMKMILSFGNPENFRAGQKALTAAVIGLIIMFSAYMLVSFILMSIGVDPAFRAVI